MLERSILANRLRELMQERNLTQRELAALLDIRPGTLCRYMQESQIPHPDVLCRLHELFGEPVESILGIDTGTEPCTYKALRAVIRRSRKNLSLPQRQHLALLLTKDPAALRPDGNRPFSDPSAFRWREEEKEEGEEKEDAKATRKEKEKKPRQTKRQSPSPDRQRAGGLQRSPNS